MCSVSVAWVKFSEVVDVIPSGLVYSIILLTLIVELP